jgi:hypothetical protein
MTRGEGGPSTVKEPKTYEGRYKSMEGRSDLSYLKGPSNEFVAL